MLRSRKFYRQTARWPTFAVEGRLYSNALNGDNTAIIFYLKNRDPKKWKDHPVSADIELKKTELDLLKAENERKKLELEQKKLDYQMECLRYQISGAQGDEKTEAIKEFLEAVNPQTNKLTSCMTKLSLRR